MNISATLLLTISTFFVFSVWPAMAGPKEITTMDPVAERGERQVTAEDVAANIRNRFPGADVDTTEYGMIRSEERENSRRDDIDSDNLDEEARRDIACLTEAIYFESANEPTKGQIAVANVIMNRAAWNENQHHPMAKHRIEFSGSICDVVAFKASRSYSKRIGKKHHHHYRTRLVSRTITTCAFSYRCERGFRKKLERVKQKEKWNEIKTLATEAYLSYNSDENVDPSGGALFYHATWMPRYPQWARVYRKTSRIGLHQFYRIP